MGGVKKIWRTIKLGTKKITFALKAALIEADCYISAWAEDIMNQSAFTLSEGEREVDLVVLSVAELGFNKGACLKDIYAKAKELGLGLCPAEVGPQLRLQYSEQPTGEWLIVAMEPVTDSVGILRELYVGRENDGGLWLYGDHHYPDSVRYGNCRFVFMRDRQPSEE
jgi:hypothetical protein